MAAVIDLLHRILADADKTPRPIITSATTPGTPRADDNTSS